MLGLATLAFKLLGIGKAIGRAVKAGLRWTLSDWRHVLIVALVSTVGVLWLQSGKWQGRAERALATIEQRDKTIADMKAASEAARAAQIAMNEKRTQDEKDIANEADKNDAIAQREAGNRAILYRDRWRVRNICQSSAAGADSPAKDSVAESGNGPGNTADMVAISSADFDRCTTNSIRLQSVNQWGEDLIAKGLAVEGD